MTLPDELQTALQTIPALSCWPPSDWRIERLGGVTNRNYRLRREQDHVSASDVFSEDDFVLRLPGAGTSSYLNRQAGIHNAVLAAGLGLAPPIVFADPERGWQLSRFLPHAKSLDAADLRKPEARRSIAALLGRLQREGGAFQHLMLPFVIADRYLSLAPEPQLLALRRQAKSVEEEIEATPLPLVPAHIDPNPANFLRRADGGLYLIDWEFSAMADPCWDLAAVAIEANLQPTEMADFLIAAGHDENPGFLRRLDLFQCALCLVASSWAYVEIGAGNDSPELRQFAERRRKECARRLQLLGSS